MPKVTKKTLKDELGLRPVPSAMETDADDAPSTSGAKIKFAPMSVFDQNGKKIDFRRITVPQQRMTPLKTAWLSLYTPVTEQLHLDMRMNLKTRKVEIKTTPKTVDIGHLQKAADFVHAFILGFEVADAIALLRLDDLFIESFEIKDVKTLRGEHLSRCIGRISGKSGKTKFTIENSTKTRVVLADTRIHILGSYQNIRVCRDAICGLILGSPPGKVYSKLRSVCSRLNSSY
ncbi:hypothetical protein CVIRNUC_007656 [Coccomyxa viridis]|uniref:PNO1 second type I KH domain-containing protein n=1 Tax=Coccomyxa viridis TaxID=1274662 RepID=A0AAV1IE25_9CHLO|nr:hypothetical protein CVIRNUC_007656 [Coccomyxa viridis]